MARYNVTLTTLIEAIGELLDDGEDPVPEKAVRRAQQLDRERRSRR